MPGGLSSVWRRVDQDRPVFLEAELVGPLAPCAEWLRGRGLLVAAAPSRFASCRGCGESPVGRVEWVHSTRAGRSVPYLPCPRCGPVALKPEDLRQWAVDVPGLLAAVFEAAGGRGAPAEVVPDHLWRLGHATWAGRRREAYFVRRVHDGSRPALAAAVRSHPKAVLLFAAEAGDRAWRAITDNPALALESATSLGPDGIVFETAVVEGLLADDGLVGKPTARKKPHPKRGIRLDKIERLTQVLAEHLREAREHAFAMRDMKVSPALLPRPSQKELAERCGLTESDVSRCLADDSARELTYLWELALDLDRVLGFRGRARRRP